jgi:hypothetical protein
MFIYTKGKGKYEIDFYFIVNNDRQLCSIYYGYEENVSMYIDRARRWLTQEEFNLLENKILNIKGNK